MKTCNNCRIQVNSSREFCPLCGQTMARSTGEGYSAYPKLELPRRRFGRLKLLLIFTQVFLGITVLVDAPSGRPGEKTTPAGSSSKKCC